MKKIIFTLLLCGIFSFSGYSQLKFGVEGGGNFTYYSQNNADIIASNMEAGWLAGIKLRSSGETWYGQVQAYYQRFSSSITSKNLAIPANGIITGNFSWESIQIPVTAGAYFNKGDNVQWRAFGGFDVAFRTNVKDNTFNVTSSQVKGSNWGTRFGIGIDFAERFALDVLYNIGFTSVFRHSDGGFRNLAIILGVNIN